MQISLLWRAPEVNPVNNKARSVPILNPFNKYGAVFFFSWMGFMLAFWAWYTFPPLLTVSIREDIGLTDEEVANSNIVSLSSTLLMRLLAGPFCDRFGSRYTYGGLLVLGAIPVGLAPLVTSASGLYVSRFFIGILGATFVPCQVWCTGFFDKNIVGTANAFAGGWGNAGGGITYFIMPAVYDSFRLDHGYSSAVSWRLTFIVPTICLIACAIGCVLCCQDTPTGKWADRHLDAKANLQGHGVPPEANSEAANVVDVPGTITDRTDGPNGGSDIEKQSEGPGGRTGSGNFNRHEVPLSKTEMQETAHHETVVKPSLKESLKVAGSPQTIFHLMTYACSFGGELAINSILASYYLQNFPHLGQTGASHWAAMFGFLNFVTRPMGGVVGDLVYRYGNRNLWYKKAWIVVCGVMTGALLILIGQLNPMDEATMFGLIFLMAVFHEAGNGANFALVPHVHPHANGIISGLTGAAGNMGGVIFAIIFRFVGDGSDYAQGFWVIGIMQIGMNLVVAWIPPLPKGQVGGH